MMTMCDGQTSCASRPLPGVDVETLDCPDCEEKTLTSFGDTLTVSSRVPPTISADIEVMKTVESGEGVLTVPYHLHGQNGKKVVAAVVRWELEADNQERRFVTQVVDSWVDAANNFESTEPLQLQIRASGKVSKVTAQLSYVEFLGGGRAGISSTCPGGGRAASRRELATKTQKLLEIHDASDQRVMLAELQKDDAFKPFLAIEGNRGFDVMLKAMRTISVSSPE
jgi:hypothetical protein